MSEKVFRTAIYARLSREDGDKAESNSIVSQKALCEEYVKTHRDLEVVDSFVDDGFSGVDFNRPGFLRMELAAREGKIEAILCKDLSRLTRNYIEGGRYLERVFPQLGIRFIAINDSYDSLHKNEQSDSFVLPFKNLINDTYCKDISVKIRTNLDVKRRRGEFVGAYTPYGYAKDPTDKNKLVVDKEAGETVRKIFSMYKDGIGIGGIADRLNGMGILSPLEHKVSSGIHYGTSFKRKANAKWSYTAVRRILTNEVYTGMLVQGRRGTPNYKVHEVREKDESEWVRYEDAHEPLVSYDDFMSVRMMLGRDVRSSSGDSEDNIFSGFLFCADCGQQMTRKAVPSKKKKYYYYVCSTNRHSKGCRPHSISAKRLEKTVTNAVRLQIANVLDTADAMEYIRRLPAGGIGEFSYEAQIARAEDDIEGYKKKKLKLYEDLSDGIIDKKEYSDFRSQYTALMEEREMALERLRRESREARLGTGAEKAWIGLFRENQNFESLDRRVLMGLVDKVKVFDGNAVEVSFRYGDEFQRAEEFVRQHREMVPGLE